MPRTLRFNTLLDPSWDHQDRSELLRIQDDSRRALSAEFDWNDRITLFEGGPRAARNERASRFADC